MGGEGGRLAGQVAIVTGAGQGIGEAIARRFAREGAAIGLIEVDIARGEAVAASIRADGGRALAAVADVSVRDQVEAAVSAIGDALGPPTVLVNNAGIAVRDDPLKLSDEDWRRSLAVDLDGVWHGIRAVLPAMLARGRGSIVTIASVHAFQIVPGYFPYPVAKHAVIGLTRAIAIEYAARGIRCNAICPGAVATPINVAIWQGSPDPAAERRRWEALHPLRRIAEPHEIASAALFLASEEAAFITGASLMVDGGRSVLYHE